MFSVLHILTKIWLNLVHPYAAFPWKLASLVDTRLTEREVQQLGSSFRNAKSCCLDQGFTARLQGRVQSIDSMLPGGQLHGIISLLSHQKILNAEIEDNFARAASTARTARGCFKFSETGLLEYSLILFKVGKTK